MILICLPVYPVPTGCAVFFLALHKALIYKEKNNVTKW
jgi:hypothetical protein